MSAVFLRLELVAHDGKPGNVVLVNVDSIQRIYPAWPRGSSVVTTDATLHVKHSFEDLTKSLIATGGNVMVKLITEHNEHVDVAYETMRADVLP